MDKKIIVITALLVTVILAAVLVKSTSSTETGESDELTWLRLNETLPSATSVMPVRYYDNNHQEGMENEGGIELTLDGKQNTIWHSAYYPELRKVTPETPADLVYEFEGVDRIDRMVYVPRTDGALNGNITQAEVYVKTKQDKEELYFEVYNTKPNSEPLIFPFIDKLLLQPISIKVRVSRGHKEFGSCAEMKFLKDTTLAQTSSLFTDELCTKLKKGVTNKDIEREDVPVLRELARQLKAGTYRTDYRVATYECYDAPWWLETQWKNTRNRYDMMQGVTGIMMEPGKHLVMASGIPDSLNVQLKVVAWYTGITLQDSLDSSEGNPDIQYFHLRNGANIIEYDSKWNGLAYISYFSEGYADKNPPISVHFVGGTINGYLSPDKTNEQMHQMTAAAPSRFIDLVSKKVHAVWTSAGMHEFCKADDGKSPGYRQYMNILDSLMTWTQRNVGFEKYGHIPRNHTLLYVNFTYNPAFNNAEGISIHVDNEINQLNCRSLIYDCSECLWDYGHEWGHQHQLRYNFRWGGLAEVSNELNAYYCVMRMGYHYDQISIYKRVGIYNSIMHYLNDETDDCLFKINDTYDHQAERLAPLLKLCNYFTNEGGKPDYLPDLYEALRYTEIEADPTYVAPYIMNFIRTASAVSGYNLLPYFERFGFLRVTSFEIKDKYMYNYQLTQEQLNAFRKEMDDLAQKENLKTMPDGMIEKIAHTPDIEYERPHFEN